jgi:hypothetical protein
MARAKVVSQHIQQATAAYDRALSCRVFTTWRNQAAEASVMRGACQHLLIRRWRSAVLRRTTVRRHTAKLQRDLKACTAWTRQRLTSVCWSYAPCVRVSFQLWRAYAKQRRDKHTLALRSQAHSLRVQRLRMLQRWKSNASLARRERHLHTRTKTAKCAWVFQHWLGQMRTRQTEQAGRRIAELHNCRRQYVRVWQVQQRVGHM